MSLENILSSPWAIHPPWLDTIHKIYALHVAGESADIEAIEKRLGHKLDRPQQGYTIDRGVAVIPIDGVVSKRMNLLSQVSGGASSELVARDIRQAVADAAVKSIVLSIDSPGGTVDGTQQLARVVKEAARSKPVVTHASGMICSAAYWIGSAADAVYLSCETDAAGSIGVVASHVNVSQAEQMAGVKTTEITAGKYKRISSQYAPLSQEGRSVMQGMVDELYAVMLTDIGTYRRKSAEAVHASMGDGRIFLGRGAVQAGLADGIMSLDALIDELA